MTCWRSPRLALSGHFWTARRMSAFVGKADISDACSNVLLMTQSGHCGTRQEPEAVLCRVIPATQPSGVRNVALFETLGLHS